MSPQIEIIRKSSSDFMKEETPKNLLVLHYTAGGTLAGAEATLAIKDYVNVHYCLDRDGKVYQYFDERYYAYHTGTGVADAKRSIGIEIVNWGHLDRKGNALYSWVNKLIPWTDVIKLQKFRGYEYGERLTPEQETMIPLLVADICSRWPGMAVTTHAMMNAKKLDFPPGYPVISDLLTM